jgi:lysophospholipase L1-like esterase
MKRPTLCFLLILAGLSSSPMIHGADTPHDFAKWEKEIAAYEATDRANPPPKGGLLFTGASSIRRWTTLAEDFPKHTVLNRGVGGSEIEDITHFADRIVFPYAPRMIFLRSGGNDIYRGKSPERVFADFKAFVTKVHATLPQTRIVFISQNPTAARIGQWEKEKALNTMVAEFVRNTPNLGYVDVSDVFVGADGQPRLDLFVADKLHFNAAGYKLFADRIRPQLPK